MDRLKHDLSLRLVKILAVLMATLPFAACWFLYYAQRIYVPFYARESWLVIALFTVLYISFARIYDAFLVSVHRISEMIYSQGLAALISDGIMYIVIWLLSSSWPNILPGLAAFAAQLAGSVIWSVLAHKWYYSVFPPKRSAIIYGCRLEMEHLIREYGLEKKFDIRLSLEASECSEDLSILQNMEAVFISGVHSHDRNRIIKFCVANGIHAYVLPRIGDILMSGAKRVHMFHLPMLRIERRSLYPEQAIVKRLFDILFSLIILVMLSPLMLVTAIMIKATDGGPVFYKQKRLTVDGKEFEILKFRSMRVDAEKDGVARLSSGDNDDRITPVGRFIRKVRIDELPQFFNILGGSMSVVGPRPERPEIAEQYEKELPEFRLRLQVKAGLTGYAQVYGKYNTSPYDKLQMDLMYIANPSFVEDLRIIFATVKILFVPESTDGVSEGQITAIETERNEAEELAGIGR